jgi:tRNA-specific 2-thiouridylase
VRSTRAPLPARLQAGDGRAYVDLGAGESGVAPGQACVFYAGDGAGARVLGGGWIERAEHSSEAETALRRIVAAPVAAAVA